MVIEGRFFPAKKTFSIATAPLDKAIWLNKKNCIFFVK